MMSPDYCRRDYLLPKGCKDLIDVINLMGPGEAHTPIVPGAPLVPKKVLLLSQQTSAGELADLLHKNPLLIIADLMELGVFASLKQPVPFDIASKLAQKYGYTARKIP